MWMGQQRLLGHEVRRLHAEFTTVVQFRSPRSPLRRPCASGDDARCVPVLGRAAPPEAHAGLLEPDGVQFGSPLPFSLFVSPRHFSITVPHGHASPCALLPRSHSCMNASLSSMAARLRAVPFGPRWMGDSDRCSERMCLSLILTYSGVGRARSSSYVR